MEKQSIKFWNEDDRPREKAISKGLQTLSDVELLAVLIGKGTAEANAVEVAKMLYQTCDNSFNTLASKSLKEMCAAAKGIGPVKAVSIAVALEIARRRQLEVQHRATIDCTKDVLNLLQPQMQDSNHEQAYIIYLRNTKVITIEQISTGGLNSTVVDSRVILKSAIMHNATAIILVHNHPSGICAPSMQDNYITHRLLYSSFLMDIALVDHVIIGGDGQHYSYRDAGEIANIKQLVLQQLKNNE
jgi:DNA repair protein RadC